MPGGGKLARYRTLWGEGSMAAAPQVGDTADELSLTTAATWRVQAWQMLSAEQAHTNLNVVGSAWRPTGGDRQCHIGERWGGLPTPLFRTQSLPPRPVSTLGSSRLATLVHVACFANNKSNFDDA